MTYKQLWGMLQQAGIENARDEARLLLLHFCGVTPAQLPFRMQEDFTCEALADAVARRQARVPLQYLLGEWEFFGLPFFVSPDCLIPRPDTEILVERAIARMPKGAHFADFCTGSGCIACAALVNRPDTRAALVDAFVPTLEMARKNCEKNGVAARAELILCDLLQPLEGVFAQKFDCILSNPPYIPTEAVKGLAPELAHEPQVALDGGEDGMIFYEHFLGQTAHVLKEGGFWLFEIGYDQEDAIKALASRLHFSCEVERDLGGNPRVAYIYR
ncbi:MAG: peptide chain release factor N(5)-glutamine methyltransferase [Clostridia bacterium]|nr:peptide chain release factor N(5)-glutamine methyltransferase [Clostridia bacterium]